MDWSQVSALLGAMAAATVVITYLLHLFIKPMITEELNRQRIYFDGLFNNHLREDHSAFNGGYRDGKRRARPIYHHESEEEGV